MQFYGSNLTAITVRSRTPNPTPNAMKQKTKFYIASELDQALQQEINMHETPVGRGGLRGSSGRSDEWERGFCQAMRHLETSILPALERESEGL